MVTVQEQAVDERPGRPSMERPDPESVWVRTIVGWHVAFWLVLAVCTTSTLVTEGVSRASQVATVAALAFLGATYAWFTRRPGNERVRRNAFTYLTVLCVVTGTVIALGPSIAFFLFIAYPQIWFLNQRVRDGVVWSVLLTAAATAGFLVRYGVSTEVLRDIGPEMVVSLAFSLLLGIWIARLIDQSQQRADLIDELERTRAELGEAHHAAGVVAERERMAREIHDTLAQGFTSVIALAQAERARLAHGGDDAPRLATLEDTARENLTEARALVAAFSPVDLGGVGLVGALRRLADRFAAESGVPVDLQLPDDGTVATVDTAGAVVLLRVAQEALSNVRRHAGAEHVTLRLSAAAELAVEVRDDGAGFEITDDTGGFGLSGMRHRVEEAGGRLDVDSAPGAGTRVTASLP